MKKYMLLLFAVVFVFSVSVVSADPEIQTGVSEIPVELVKSAPDEKSTEAVEDHKDGEVAAVEIEASEENPQYFYQEDYIEEIEPMCPVVAYSPEGLYLENVYAPCLTPKNEPKLTYAQMQEIVTMLGDAGGTTSFYFYSDKDEITQLHLDFWALRE